MDVFSSRHAKLLNFRSAAACPPEVVENQSFIFDVTMAYLPKPERNLAGGCPGLSAALPVHHLQKSLKINILYPASRSAAHPVGADVSMGAVAAFSRL